MIQLRKWNMLRKELVQPKNVRKRSEITILNMHLFIYKRSNCIPFTGKKNQASFSTPQ